MNAHITEEHQDTKDILPVPQEVEIERRRRVRNIIKREAHPLPRARLVVAEAGAMIKEKIERRIASIRSDPPRPLGNYS